MNKIFLNKRMFRIFKNLKQLKNKKAFTLIELQVGSIMMVAVLLATGVLFYFSLASLRYMHDVFEVVANANAAMKVIAQEVMISNCYGRTQNPAGLEGTIQSFYGNQGYRHNLEGGGFGGFAFMALPGTPTLANNYSAWTDVLYLSQAHQQKTGVAGVAALNAFDNAGNFPTHDAVLIYRDAANTVYIDRRSPINPLGIGGGTLIATNIEALDFWPVHFNCVAVRLTARGTVPDPTSPNRYCELVMSRFITLRCAPLSPPVHRIGSNDLW